MKRVFQLCLAFVSLAVSAVTGGCEKKDHESAKPPDKKARWQGEDSGYQSGEPDGETGAAADRAGR
ncbi:MAG: hypothetical protein GXY83_20775 [Rhodopirellula sp.]|nr:hypothetical protein [Rhodopirellula sp.]